LIAGAAVFWPGFSARAVALRQEPSTLLACRYVGAVSCAAVACHNAGGPMGAKQSEYATWLQYDPHARAFAVLSNSRSLRIERNLYGHDRLATEDDRCLRCHAPAGAANDDAGEVLRREGVGCEACHGPAQEWLAEHYTSAWQLKSNAEKGELGYRPTKDLLFRARSCVPCHVGTPEQQVDHDLIAAGHPRLAFELGAYHAILPKHWRQQDDKVRNADFEIRLWALGQVASAQAAYRLVAFRAAVHADGSSQPKPWPEFAEYDCFSCHHDLQPAGWRRAPESLGVRTVNQPVQYRAVLRWATWYRSELNRALSLRSANPDQMTLKEFRRSIPFFRKLTELPAMMEEGKDRQSIAETAESAADRLEPVLHALAAREPFSPAAVRAAFADAVGAGAMEVTRASVTKLDPDAEDWQQAAQRYFAVAAMYNALTDLDQQARDAQERALIDQLGSLLEFPRQGSVRYSSPATANESARADRFLQTLHALRAHVQRQHEGS
jgi:hypothetical protein